MDSAFDLRLDPSIVSRVDLLGRLTELAQSAHAALPAGPLEITARLLQIMNREFIALEFTSASRTFGLELTKRDLGNLWRIQKRIARAWHSAPTRQSA
ncbi:MAG: hypothetical protein ACM359_02735 [Bacillota bacterium]